MSAAELVGRANVKTAQGDDLMFTPGSDGSVRINGGAATMTSANIPTRTRRCT